MTRPLVLITVLAAVLAACDFQQVIDLDVPPYESRLVVGGFPTPDTVFSVRLARSASVLEPSFPGDAGLALRNARVALFDADGGLLDSLRHQPNSGGVYVSRQGIRPESGRGYILRADASDLPPVEATTTIPIPVPFDVRVEDVTANEFGERNARLVVTVPDAPELQTYSLVLTREDPTTGGGSRFFAGFRSTDPLLREDYSRLDVAVDIEVELESDGRFFGSEAVFRDALFEGSSHAFVLDVPIGFSDPSEPVDLTVALSTLSEPYARYRQTLALQDENRDNPFSEPVRLFSNVEGGLGAFAGYATSFAEVRIAP